MAANPSAYSLGLFHPLASLEWQEWPSLRCDWPMLSNNPQLVWFQDTLYLSAQSYQNVSHVYSFKPGVDQGWSSVIKTPTNEFGFVVHESQLLLVGGKEPSGDKSSCIFTLNDGKLVQTFPPMIESVVSPAVVSYQSVLFVAGLDSVQFLKDGQWHMVSGGLTYYESKSSALIDDEWYLITGDTKIISISLSSILHKTSLNIKNLSLASNPETHHSKNEALSVLNGQLFLVASSCPIQTIDIDESLALQLSRTGIYTSSQLSGRDMDKWVRRIYTFSSSSQSWSPVADLPKYLEMSVYRSSVSSLVLPSGELVIAKAYFRQVKFFVGCTWIALSSGPEDLLASKFTLSQLSRLNDLGVDLFTTLSTYQVRLLDALKIKLNDASLLSDIDFLKSLYEVWENSDQPTYPLTWSGLFSVLDKIDLGHLEEQITEIFTGSDTVKKSSYELKQVERSGDKITRETLSSTDHDDPKAQTTVSLGLGQKLELEDVHSVTVHASDQWFQLGLVLGIEYSRLKRISEHHPGDDKECLCEMLSHLLQTRPQLTWGDLCSALRHHVIRRPDLAEIIESKYLPASAVDSPKSRIERITQQEKPDSSKDGSQTQTTASPTSLDLPGVEVDGRTSFVVTNTAACFSWDDHGLNLDVPENSLPVGLPECTLDLISSYDGKYLLPPDHEAFSPVYWVRPTPPCRFQKPLTLKIQHWAKMTPTTELVFVRALCSQEKLPYDFTEVHNKGSFSASSSFGSLDVTSFSGYRVSGRHGRVDKVYFGSTFSRIVSPHCIDIFFVIALDHRISRKKVKNRFDELNAEEKSFTSFAFEFERDTIQLEIPNNGVSAGFWTLKPLVKPPQIYRRRVDLANGSNSVISQQLQATLPDDWTGPTPSLSHSITLRGARFPEQVEVVWNPTPIAVCAPSPEARQTKSYGQKLEVLDIYTMTYGAADQWFKLGLALKVDYSHLSAISKNHSKCEDCLLEMLARVLKQTKPDLTWEDLSSALRHDAVGRTDLAEKIEEKYLSRGLSALQINDLLSDDQMNTPLTEQDCVMVAAFFDNFELYIHFFNLENFEKEDVKRKGTDNRLAVTHLLNCWRKKFTRTATFKELLSTLTRLGKGEIVEKVCKYVQENIATPKTPLQEMPV